MASSIASAAGASLSKERLTFEPAMMVNSREELAPRPDKGILTVELSNVDQLYKHYNAIALFYGTPPQGAAKSSVNVGGALRSALEELLAHYPWAAGRMRENKEEQRQEVACDGQGVQFVAVHVDMTFSELGDVSSAHPSLDLLFPRLRQGDGDPPMVAIQVTRFKCGGFTLSFMAHHALMDGYAAPVFLQNLCSIARGAVLLVPPDQVSRRERLKPRTPPSPTFHLHQHILEQGEGVTFTPRHNYGNATRYAFSSNALETLRRRVLSDQQLLDACSRYQALAALLWTTGAKSLLGGRLPPSHELPLKMSMNVREKIMPTITRGYMGNATYQVTVMANVQELIKGPLSFLVHKISSALTNVMPECVQSQTDYIELLGAGARAQFDDSLFGIPSLVSLPFYDTDCGWGSPVYCGRPSKQLTNIIIILDGRGSWNVLVVFESEEERVLFEETIGAYIILSS